MASVPRVTVVAAEPDLEQSWHWQEQRLPGDSFAARSTTDCTPEGQKGGKYDEGDGFGWHLADSASGLRAARETVGGAAGNITIVHLDTGYDPDHMALPTGLDRDRQRNFIDGEDNNDASDHTPPGRRAAKSWPRHRHHRHPGRRRRERPEIAAEPTARIRRDRRCARRARGAGPHRQLGRAVPDQHCRPRDRLCPGDRCGRGVDEHGRAALLRMGGRGEPRLRRRRRAGLRGRQQLRRPADQPDRLSGPVSAGDRRLRDHGGGPPVSTDLGGPMEGNVGPASKMATAMAAYTPNIPWLRLGCRDVVDMDGSGTSSATPQIAAAAGALAARNMATTIRAAGSGWKRCAPRCSHRPTSTDAIRRTIPIHSSAAAACAPPRRCRTSTVPAAASLRRNRPGQRRISPSCTCCPAYSASAGWQPAECRDAATGADAARTEFARGARGDARSGRAGRSGHGDSSAAACSKRSWTDGSTLPRAAPEARGSCWGARRSSPIPRHPPQRAGTAATGSGTDIVRRVMIMQPPTRRRLRVFATDPGDSSRLQTSFVNTATVESTLGEQPAPRPGRRIPRGGGRRSGQRRRL